MGVILFIPVIVLPYYVLFATMLPWMILLYFALFSPSIAHLCCQEMIINDGTLLVHSEYISQVILKEGY
jgi:hypothetical protein